MPIQNTASERIGELVLAQRNYFASGVTLNPAFRKEQLKHFRDGLRKWEPRLCDALWADLHKSYEEAYLTELGLVFGEIGDALRHLHRWTRRRRKPTPLTGLPSRSYVVREPLGCSLIVSPWNYPVQLLLNPLVGALSAGCTAILKPSPYVPTVSQVLGDFIADTFDERLVAVVQGDRSVNAQLFDTRFDLVFFTGSPALGRVVMQAQARYLTPLVLELGGKSPCIVDRDADLTLAARRIVWGKCLNSGQTCIAPDYLFLHEDIKDAFVAAFQRELDRLYPEGTEHARHYVHMVRDAAFERVSAYLKEGTVLCGGRSDAASRWIEPTLLGDVPEDARVLKEEIFGPVFPILTFRERKEVEDYVNAHEKPLAFYYFGRRAPAWELIAHTSSGGACVNDTIMHITNSRIPFGGVGNSGMGNYHGERSFLAFTHERSVMDTPTWTDLPFRYMPYRFFNLVKRLLG